MNDPDTRPAADTLDQAAGLRRWAEKHKANPNATAHQAAPLSSPAPDRTLILFGPTQAAGPAHETLERWHRQGHQWIGHPARWRLLLVDNKHRNLQALTRQQPRWGLWIDSDLDAFRRAFQTLCQLSEQGGPDHVLALHAGFPRQGLLNNLREAAHRYLGVRLLLIDEISD